MADEKNADKEKENVVVGTMRNGEVLERIKSELFTKGAVAALLATNAFLVVAIAVMFFRPARERAYLIEVNGATGETRRVENAIQDMSSYTTPEWLMTSTVKNYITTLRSVSSDVLVNRKSVDWVKSFSTEQAATYATAWLRENNPMLRCERERVEVDIINCMPISTADRSINKFQIDWNEKTRSISDGKLKEERNYRADIDLKQFKATPMSSERNALGFYIVYLYISEIKDGYVVKEGAR